MFDPSHHGRTIISKEKSCAREELYEDDTSAAAALESQGAQLEIVVCHSEMQQREINSPK